MARAIYIVLLSRDHWWIDLEGKAYGPFSSAEAARREAVELARFLAHTGRACEVRVPDETGRYAVVWESGQEPALGHGPSFGTEPMGPIFAALRKVADAPPTADAAEDADQAAPAPDDPDKSS